MYSFHTTSNLTLAEEAKQHDRPRWHPSKRNPLTRDAEVWDPLGNCFVYLFPKGQSLRGPAFRVSSSMFFQTGCHRLLRACLHHGNDQDPNTPALSLFLPGPDHLPPDEAFKYHCTTRNFFRCIVNKPLIGNNLGSQLIDTAERLFQCNGSQAHTMEIISGYMENQGYLNLEGDADIALAILQFAEYFQIEDLWKDAFVQCVGMYEVVRSHVMYEQQSDQTKKQLYRARIKLDLQMESNEESSADINMLPLDIYGGLTARQHKHSSSASSEISHPALKHRPKPSRKEFAIARRNTVAEMTPTPSTGTRTPAVNNQAQNLPSRSVPPRTSSLKQNKRIRQHRSVHQLDSKFSRPSPPRHTEIIIPGYGNGSFINGREVYYPPTNPTAQSTYPSKESSPPSYGSRSPTSEYSRRASSSSAEQDSIPSLCDPDTDTDSRYSVDSSLSSYSSRGSREFEPAWVSDDCTSIIEDDERFSDSARNEWNRMSCEIEDMLSKVSMQPKVQVLRV